MTTPRLPCPISESFDPLSEPHLGKLEARIALEEIMARWPGLRLVDGQVLTFHPNISFRGPQRLRVRRVT